MENVGILARVDSAATYTDDEFHVLGRNTVKHDEKDKQQISWYPGLFYVGKNYMPAMADFDVVEPGIFFISATLHIQGGFQGDKHSKLNLT